MDVKQSKQQEEAVSDHLGAIVTAMQSMQKDISDLRSRIDCLEKENETLRTKMERYAEVDGCKNTSDRKRRHIETACLEVMCTRESKWNQTCSFCSKIRCQSCEKRISMLPTILTLLVKNGFVDELQLGALACTSKMLQKFICIDADEDIWENLLHEKWPSTRMMPKEVRGALSNRTWYERLATAICPGAIEEEDVNECGEEIRKRYITYRGALLIKQGNKRIEGAKEVFPPLGAPSVGTKDLMLLIDIFGGQNCDGHLLSVALSGNEIDTLFQEISSVIISANVMSTSPIKLSVDDDSGEFIPKATLQDFFGLIHIVRLTDYKIICLHQTKSIVFKGHDDIPFDERQMGAVYMKGNDIGSIPTFLTCRIENFLQLDIGFAFDMLLCIDFPRSPGDFGIEYTKQKFIGHDTVYPFDSFSGRVAFRHFKREKWREAATRFERERFFGQAEAEATKDGGYFGAVKSLTIYPLDLSSLGVASDSGITVLHMLGDLLDFDEPAINICREEDDDSNSDSD
mmetsp:Transcript_14172/g.21764  ORF Transcript_14172/g.21764 Transcript_14172/m.21764 type:complete len:515 (-) Transcript_14172:127-1671(-)|eukprot:CAMPEP_0196806142 /NCGR_PEP_ID=MMETSP1362-20130617/6008_1 /TAXON_ID=163516 /ORGANISM="Leptocylindrus danicus, Strain CCMP1856" /LENGTH=514 /DNA_ID=CAMNT_0042179467 /DNA_START=294 /DNA_END=1838 /DNA_ORIENTATION=+